jgi:hypothetical protein
LGRPTCIDRAGHAVAAQAELPQALPQGLDEGVARREGAEGRSLRNRAGDVQRRPVAGSISCTTPRCSRQATTK